MRLAKKSFLFVLQAAVLCLLPVLASANTITYGPTSFGAFATGSSGGFSVPQFDPSFGTLTQVDLFVTGHADGGSNGVENLNPEVAGLASAAIGANITVSGPAALTVLTLPATSLTNVPVSAFDGTVDFGGTSGFTVSGAPSSDSQSDLITSGLGPYVGLGSVSFSYSSTTNTSSSSTVAPLVTSAVPGIFGFDATVVYHYDPVPEPSTLALGFLGLCALGFSARKAK